MNTGVRLALLTQHIAEILAPFLGNPEVTLFDLVIIQQVLGGAVQRELSTGTGSGVN